MLKPARAGLLAAAALLLTAGVAPANAAAPPARTGVMLLFDTTGSMGTALEASKTQVAEIQARVRESLPDVAFGVAELRDYPGALGGGAGGGGGDTTASARALGEFPFLLDQPTPQTTSR